MRFGAFIPQGWRLDLAGVAPEDQWPAMLRVAKTIEAIGFESAWLYDHLHTVPEPTQEPMHEAWSLMAALAVTTETVRLGQMCTCVGYRNPAYLAKVAASLDVISGGRVEMGIGAGWYEHEYLGYGYEFPKPSVRIGQLAEGVEIMRRMWTENEVHHEGRYWTLQGAIAAPRPLQEPHIPLWVAGGGEQLTLRVAAEYADYTNFGGKLETFVHKSNVLAEHCEAVGRPFDEITRSANFNVICAPTEAEVEATIERVDAHIVAHTSGVSDGRRSFGPFAGTPDQLVERLAPWVDAGLEYAICYFPETAWDTSGLELFAAEVAPHL